MRFSSAGLAIALCIATAWLLPARARAAESDPATAPIATLDQALMTAMKTGSQPFPARFQALGPAVDGAFNLQQILQTSVGLRWASIPADKQKTLLSVFRAYTIANYTANFDTDSGDQLRILPETRTVGSDKVVETEIVPKSGDPTRMDYVMRQSADGWRAVDVLETGTISQVAVQRSDFRSLLEGGADKLIDSLKAKVAKLSGGTLHP
jgi:phospholipid transport system substrate-binding protein